MSLSKTTADSGSWPRRIAVSTLFVAVGMALSFCIFVAWVKLYPEDYDPKNINYVLWKHGLNANMNLDHAVSGMTHDTWAVNIVKGMSKQQLKTRFGYFHSVEETSPYLRLCYTAPETVGELGIQPHGKEVVFLRESAWMVILDGGRAADLVLCKGY